MPTAEETADAIQRAQQALIELEQRRHADAQHTSEEARRQEISRWHANETTQATDDRSDEDEQAREVAAR